MLIVCPSCTTSYEVDPVAVGESGRPVRCIRCKNVWFAGPPGSVQVLHTSQSTASSAAAADEATVAAFRDALADTSAGSASRQPSVGATSAFNSDENPADQEVAAISDDPSRAASDQASDISTEFDVDAPSAEPAEPAASASADLQVLTQDAPPLAPTGDEHPPGVIATPINEDGPADIESVARRRAKSRPPPRRSMRISSLPGLILVLVAICAALLGWRREIVRHLPQLAALYASIGLPVNLRGLAFADVKTRSETLDNVRVLIVEGTIVNIVSVPVEVPRLRFALRNTAGTEVYTWTAVPTQPVLPPGGKLPFRSRLASPPNDGHGVQVRFFTRRDLATATH
jgi:predicted Zn finger-like uncharacterized protein